jgi:hypothetical protein
VIKLNLVGDSYRLYGYLMQRKGFIFVTLPIINHCINHLVTTGKYEAIASDRISIKRLIDVPTDSASGVQGSK